nr:MAG TPA: hypothetical protein [Caudoviricetes sp.]
MQNYIVLLHYTPLHYIAYLRCKQRDMETIS